MDKAIDTFYIDNQIEVDATKIGSNRTIRAAEKRYVCPVCGEYVTFVPRNIKKAYFMHLSAENDATCDLRVSSSSSLSFYERVGNSLFLKHQNNTTFSLLIGLRGVGKNNILNYEKDNASLIIRSGSNEKDVYKINRQNFYYDEMTLLPIHSFSKDVDYKITIERGSLNFKWAEYCEGLSRYGGVFEYSLSGGKKIRKTNTIVVDKKYYILIHSDFERIIPQELNYESEGSIILSGQLCKVGSISFRGSTDTLEFDKANAFLNNRFGIRLSGGESQLIPIWPPAISGYDTIQFETENSPVNALCYVKSCKKEPTVFQYVGAGVSEVPLNLDKIVSFRLSEEELPVSVDRQYFGRNYYLKRNTGDYLSTEGTMSIIDCAGQPYCFKRYDVLPSGNALKIQSAFPLTILRINNEGNKFYHLESNSPVCVEKLRLGEILVLYSVAYIGKISFCQEKKENNTVLLSEELMKLFEIDKSALVPVEWWIYRALSLDCIDNKLEQILVSYIKKGFIPINTKNRLYSLIKELGNESI